MIIEQTFAVQAPRAETAAFFLDIDRVARCVPGVENVEEVAPRSYRAVLTVRLGPIRAAFQGTMALDAAEAPTRLRAVGEGRDRATGSVAKVQFTADLVEEQAGHTTVQAVADVALRGRMAQFGTGVMRAAAGELVQEFAACANATLAAERAEIDPVEGEAPSDVRAGLPAAAPSDAPASKGLLGLFFRSALRASWDGLRGLLGRLRGRRSAMPGRER